MYDMKYAVVHVLCFKSHTKYSECNTDKLTHMDYCMFSPKK